MTRYQHTAIRLTIAAFIALVAAPATWAFRQGHFAESSKLASGHWVKIRVAETGIHEITAQNARDWGFNDLKSLHVFGMGGPLSETLTEDIPDDLPQLPTVRTETKLLFYAQGPTTWGPTSISGMTYVQTQHPYSTYTYYFVSDAPYADIAAEIGQSTPNGSAVTTFTEHLCHEVDLVNPGETGRIYLGEDFISRNSQTFTFDLTGRVAGTEVAVLSSFGVKIANGSASLEHTQNGTKLDYNASTDRAQFSEATQDDPYQLLTAVKQFTPAGDNNTLNYTIRFTPNGNITLARLDYITVNYTRRLAMAGNQFAFDINHESLASQIVVAGADQQTVIWDVTNPTKPLQMNTVAAADGVHFSPVGTGPRRYVAFNTSSSFIQAEREGFVANQDLHIEDTPDMIIITPSEYAEQANRIADLHRDVDSMRVLVVDHKKIFNEFSSGTPDVMAYRMFCKMFYDRPDTVQHRLRYLLLMGKSTYDNRLLSPTIRALNAPMLMLWEKPGGNSHSTSSCSDDWIVTLDDNTGPGKNSSPMSIAVGRFPVKSVSEAKTAVDKLINYVTQPDYGIWKTQMLNVADDENEAQHMEQSEANISSFIANGGEDLFFNRVYLDAYPAVSSGASNTYPEAYTKHYNTLHNGVIWWNYTGHSGPHAMTANGLVRHVDINNKFYYKHLPVLYAATCDFAMFDGSDESAGETLFLNPRGGVIALVCPPRQVYISANGVLNVSVAKYAFSRDENQLPRRLGDIVMLGKNNCPNRDENRQRYFLFGDPAMRIAYPTHRIVVDSITGAETTTESGMPVFRGRQTMTVTGHIADIKGNPVNDFNGSITTQAYDYEQSITTYGYGKGKKYTYLDRTNRLAVSIDSVNAGKFTLRINLPSELLPRDAQDSVLYDDFSPSLLSMYAYSAEKRIEAMGHNDRFIIYGYDDDAVTDTIGPDILYLGLNSENFNDGDQTNESPMVIASIKDDSGINFSTAGVGHNMNITVDGTMSFNNVIDYFTLRATNDGISGTLNFPLSGLSDGPHTLRLRAWDVYNNCSEKTISFNVVNGLKPEIYEVYALGNPASVQTTFYVKHNRPDALMNVGIEVYDITGRLVWSTRQTGTSDTYTSFPITWNLCDFSGRRVGRGIYIYRATISTDGIKEATKSKRLAVTEQ